MQDVAKDVCGMAEETGGPMRTAVRSIEALVRLYLPEAGAHGVMPRLQSVLREQPAAPASTVLPRTD